MRSVVLVVLWVLSATTIIAQQSKNKAFRRVAYVAGKEVPHKPAPSNERPVFAKSLFWKVTPPNSNKASYLYGTMHVSRKIAFNLPDTFYKAIRACDVVALESNPETWISEMDKPSEVRSILDYNNIGYVRPQGSYGYYGTANDVSYINKEGLKSILLKELSEVNGLLFRSWDRNDNLEEDTYLDLFIFKAGKRYGKPIASLESVTQSTWLSIRAGIEARKDNKRKSSRSSYSSNSDIEDAYRQRDIDLLDSLQKKNASAGYLSFFLHDRNDTMVNTLRMLNAQGKSVFCAIGAAHLPGQRGMLQSLRGYGYSIEPVIFDDNYNPALNITALDEQYIPVPMTKNYTSDKSISFYTSAYSKGRSMVRSCNYLSSDMNNGIYYYLSRNSNFSVVNGQSAAQLYRNLDSLVFENTKGRLTNKTRLEVQGYPAYKIESITDDGTALQQLFIYTPLELVYMRSAGKSSFTKLQQSQLFLDSVRITYDSAMVSTLQKGYTKDIDVQMPVSIANEFVIEHNYTGQTLGLQGIDAAGDFYMMHRMGCTWAGLVGNEPDTFHLAMFAEAFADRAQAKMVQLQYFNIGGFSSAKAGYILPDGKSAEAMYIMKGINVYTLFCKSSNAEKRSAFFNSLSIIAEPRKYVKHIDTFLKLEYVTTLPRFGEVASAFYRSSGSYTLEEPDNYGRLWQDLKWHPSIDYGYQFNINTYKLNDFEAWPTLDSFWGHVQRRIISSDMAITSIDKDTVARKSLCITFRDTGSSSIIKALVLLHNNYITVLKCGYDSVTATLSDIDTIFKSLRYTSPEQLPMFVTSGKLDTLKRLVASKDSTDKDKLESNYKYMDVLPREQLAFLQYVDSCKALQNNDKLDLRNFIEDVEPKGDSMLSLLQGLYYRSAAKQADVQAILVELAEAKDSASLALFKKLLIEDAPLSETNDYNNVVTMAASAASNSYGDASVNKVFALLDDSLQLMATLMPELLQLLDYDEYKFKVMDITIALLEKKLIDKTLVEARLPLFIQYAKRKLKEVSTSKSTLARYNEWMDKTSAEIEDAGSVTIGPSSYENSLRIRQIKQGESSFEYNGYGRNSLAGSCNDDSAYYSKTENLCSAQTEYLHRIYVFLQNFKYKKQVADVLQRIDTCTHMDWLYCKALHAAQQNQEFDGEVIHKYAAMPDRAYHLALFAMKCQKVLPYVSVQRSQQDWATAIVRAQLPYRLEQALQFEQKVLVANKYGSGYVFLYSYKINKEDDKVAYAYYGMFSKTTKGIYENGVVHSGGIEMQEDVSFDAWLASLPQQIRIMGRKQIEPSNVEPWNREKVLFGNRDSRYSDY